ncbi:MAG: type I glyceraldehyde-3-phosphate dehydrogenase, partial [Ilumatobacteraceae bacterium]
MTVRVGINGFGRIGRSLWRAIARSGADIEVVAVNDLGDKKTMAHLLKYDSVMGVLPDVVTSTDDGLTINGRALKVLSERDPRNLPWAALAVDVVVESTGFFTERDKAAAHLDAGAMVVIVSAPATGADATFVYGVNHTDFDVAKHKVVSNASCTTNCFVPLVKVLDDAFGVETGMMTT